MVTEEKEAYTFEHQLSSRYYAKCISLHLNSKLRDIYTSSCTLQMRKISSKEFISNLPKFKRRSHRFQTHFFSYIISLAYIQSHGLTTMYFKEHLKRALVWGDPERIAYQETGRLLEKSVGQ